MNLAKERILAIGFPPEAEVGATYDGEVVNITKFGAFVNILPGRDGLLHISKIGGNKRIDKVEDVLALGDPVKVVVREIDDRGKVSLDMADAPGGGDAGDGDAPTEQRSDGDGSRNDRRDRGRDRDGGGRNRSRDRSRDRDRGDRNDRGGDKPGRKVVSFEDEFEAGL
jgi:polyribonucleotide nucleotidyltransferase